MNMLLMASSMTRITLGSLTCSRLIIASRAPHCTNWTTCSTVPPLVKFVTAHTASLWVLKSPWKRHRLRLYQCNSEFVALSPNSHFLTVPQEEEAGHRWSTAGFAYKVQQQCSTVPMLPPSARWPFGVSSTGAARLEHRHQLPPGSAGLIRSQCSQWSGEQGSGRTTPQTLTLCNTTT